jgi:multidrug efflux pump subunit AcrB
VPQTGIVGSDIEIGIIAHDQKKAMKSLKELEAELAKIDGVEDISENAKKGPKELKLKIKSYGQELGFSETYLINTLRGLFLEAEYGKMFDREGLIRVRIEESSKNDSIDIASVRITSPDGKTVVNLKDVTDFIYKDSMLKIFKEDAKRVWSVTARADRDRVLPSEVMLKLKPFLEKKRAEGVEFIIKGEEKENQQVKREMGQAGIIAIFLIFVALVWMFNSAVLPLITISVIPLSVFGALAGNFVVGIDLTMPGLMGIVGLAGVVVNDALIMLDFIRESENIEDLARRASIRLRPIFLTSLTTVLGLTTLIFFASGQSLIIQPMAVSLGFGVAWATVLNLIYIPLVYAVLYRVKR